jgi:hypothetical protein
MTEVHLVISDHILSIAALVVGLLGIAISVLAVMDARDQIRGLIKLERKRVYTRVRNDLVWQFVDATALSHTSEIAKGLEEFTAVSRALYPKQTPEQIVHAVHQDCLKFADRLVKSGFAVWKSDWDMDKVQEELDAWQQAINKNLLASIDPKLTEDSLF